MNRQMNSLILDTFFRYILPFILVYGVYVLIHGEYSPGGGFQAGALLAFGVVVTRLVQGNNALIDMSGNTGIIIASIGGFIFVAIGVIPIFFGGNFFNYGALPLGISEHELRPLGMLGIEVGVTLCVMGVIIAIYDALTRKDGAT